MVRTDSVPIGDSAISCLKIASSFLHHRGPDDEGLAISPSGVAAFAHRRLSIIDPTTEAHQPMVSPNGNILVFNGEIYNYQELAAAYHLRVPPSDTAVLLALLELRGTSILPELRGFFTFAWWNEPNRKLIIARDPFGKKPLYYARFSDRLLFASELRSLLASRLVKPELSSEGLGQYLRYYCVPHPNPIIVGLHALLPGSILTLQNGMLEIHRWYRLPQPQDSMLSYEEAVHEIRRILERSVQDRLVSDVPVASFLSGGLDSNVITALAARHVSEPMETFSIGFSSRQVESETGLARIGAEMYRTRHHERHFTSENVSAVLPEFFQSMDSPTGDGLNTFLVAKTAREMNPSLKVVLSGIGGDEAFMGYKKLRWAAKQQMFLKVAALTPTIIRNAMAETLMESQHTRSKAAIRTILAPEKTRALFSRSEIEHLTGERFEDNTSNDLDKNPIHSLLRSDIEHYLPDILLRDLDAMTMAHSLEARAPLLDRELMEFTWQLPLSIKLRGTTKQLLADAARDIVPPALLDKPKTGFELPMTEWLKSGNLRRYLDSLVTNDSMLIADGIVSRAGLRRIHADFVAGRSHYLKPWSLIALEYWFRHVKELSGQVPTPSFVEGVA